MFRAIFRYFTDTSIDHIFMAIAWRFIRFKFHLVIFLLPKVALISTIILWWLDRNIRRRWIFNIVLIMNPPLVLSGVLITQSSLEQFF